MFRHQISGPLRLVRGSQLKQHGTVGCQFSWVIEVLQVHVAGATNLIICATFEDMSLVQCELLGTFQRILEGLEAPPQLIFTTRAGWEARNARAGNAQSRPAV